MQRDIATAAPDDNTAESGEQRPLAEDTAGPSRTEMESRGIANFEQGKYAEALELLRIVIGAAAAIVLMHNHPSGDPTPSEADIKVTRDLIRAGQLLAMLVILGHGTELNDQEIAPEEDHKLQDGDRIRFGKVETSYFSENPAEARPLPETAGVAAVIAETSKRPADA